MTQPDLFTDPRNVIRDARRQPDFLKHFHELGPDNRGLLGRLHDDGVARHQGRCGHTAQDGERKIPGSDGDGNAAWLIEILVFLARHVAPPRRRQPQHFSTVVFAVVDALGDVGIGLAPLLAALIDFPRRQLEPPPPHDFGSTKQVLRSLRRRRIAPLGKYRTRRRDRVLGLRRRGTCAAADDLPGMGRVHRVNGRRVIHCLAAYYERVGPPDFLGDLHQCLPHRLPSAFAAEIGQRFISNAIRFGFAVLACSFAIDSDH